MEFLQRVLPVFLAALIAVSCSSEENEPYEEIEQRSFESWIKKNVPHAIKHENGMYYEWITRGGDDAPKPEWGDYVEINYRGLLISDYDPDIVDRDDPDKINPIKGNVFMTRYESDAKRLGTFTSYAHYVPQLLIYSRSSYLMEGMREALGMMRTGDMIRLFIPSSLASTTSALTMSYGYGGNAAMPSVPVIVEMELTGIDKQPQTREEKFVVEFAEKEWGQSLGDTVREYVYYREIQASESTKPEKIVADSTAKLYYAAFFAYDDTKVFEEEENGVITEVEKKYKFLIETNIDTVALRFNRDVSTSSAVSFKASSVPSSPTVATLGALYEIFNTEELVHGARYEAITTSSYAYGSSGQAPASDVTEVLPYQPIYFYIFIEEKE